MPEHFHIIAAHHGNTPTATIVFDNYEDSVEAWVKLSTLMFSTVKEPGALEIQNAKAATEDGKADAAVVGTRTICFYWLRCDSPDACYSITWN